MSSRRVAVIASVIFACGSAAALAQAAGEIDLTDPVNAQWSFNGKGLKTKVVESEGVPGGLAIEATVSRKGQNPWDMEAPLTLIHGVNQGDRVTIGFYAKSVKPDEGQDTVTLPVRLQRIAAPYDAAVEGQVIIGPEWKLHCVSGPAKVGMKAAEMKLSIQMAGSKRVVLLGPFMARAIPASSTARSTLPCA